MGFWLNKTVLVTGGAGFLGSHIVDILKSKGCKNIIVPRSREYNLVDINNVKKLLGLHNYDIIIHAAGLVGGIGANRENPGRFFYDNLMMGVQIIEEARKGGIPKTVILGTVCAYPKYTTVPFKEEDLWIGYPEETNAPYGLAKKMLLVQSQAYRQQYGYNSIFLLPVNLYGPRDNFDSKSSHVIPAIIKKCVDARRNNKDHIVIWGSGEVSREFLYVEDGAEAIVLAAEKYNKSEPVNLGSGMEIKIMDLVKKIKHLSDFGGDIVIDRSKPEGQPRRSLDTTKAENEFGFKAKRNFDEGLKKTIAWYEQNFIS